jgi:hypothetical protein
MSVMARVSQRKLAVLAASGAYSCPDVPEAAWPEEAARSAWDTVALRTNLPVVRSPYPVAPGEAAQPQGMQPT